MSVFCRTQEEWLADGAACLEAALVYRAVGWCPIPLCPPDHVGVPKGHGKTCDHPGKVPMISAWSSLAGIPSEAQLRAWWRTWCNANVGIVMGTISGIVGLDIDGEAGEAELARLIATGKVPPPTAAFRSGKGRRLLFAIDPGLVVVISKTSLNGKHSELRLLGEGSQTVAPPSRHPSGGYYEWTAATR